MINKTIKELLCSHYKKDVALGLELARRRKYKSSTISRFYWDRSYLAEQEIYNIFHKYLLQEDGNSKFIKWKENEQ